MQNATIIHPDLDLGSITILSLFITVGQYVHYMSGFKRISYIGPVVDTVSNYVYINSAHNGYKGAELGPGKLMAKTVPTCSLHSIVIRSPDP